MGNRIEVPRVRIPSRPISKESNEMDITIEKALHDLNRNEPYVKVCLRHGMRVTNLRGLVYRHIEEFAKLVCKNKYDDLIGDLISEDYSHSHLSKKYGLSIYLISVLETSLKARLKPKSLFLVQSDSLKLRCHACGAYSILSKGEELVCKRCGRGNV